jgi:ABC-2 type transport system ATP-binding protein
LAAANRRKEPIVNGQRGPDQALPLIAEGLGKQYRRGWALRETFLAIPNNRIVALVGPNGAGKSTLMGLTTGLLRPTTGAITVFGDRPTGKGCTPRCPTWPSRSRCTSSSP